MLVVPFLFLAAVCAIIYGVASIIFRPRRGKPELIRYYDASGYFFEEHASFIEKRAKGAAGGFGGERAGVTVAVTAKHLVVRTSFNLEWIPFDLLNATIPVSRISKLDRANRGYYGTVVEFEREDLSVSKLWLRLRWAEDFVDALNDVRSSESVA